jgi:hypothetical protein
MRVIKSKKMRWAGNVAFMGEMRIAYNISVRKFEAKRSFSRSNLDGKIILKWIFTKLGVRV